MRANPIKQEAKAFSLVELFIIVALVAVVAALLLPVHPGNRRPTWLRCISNLRQVGLGMHMFAGDHNNQFPMQTSITNEGSMEFVSAGSPAPHFQTVSNYLAGNWAVLLCPADTSKQRATNRAVISDRNISYFLSMDATYGSRSAILAGDRNLAAGGKPVKPGLFSLTTNAAVTWTSELHSDGRHPLGGSLLFVDGHAEFSRQDLPAVIERQNLATNLLVIP